MVPDVRKQLREAWGFCERHAWGAILVEASFRHGYMHGPAILYEDLLGLALPDLHLKGPLTNLRLLRNLREKGLCLMCDMGLGPESEGVVTAELVNRGQDPGELRRFAQETEPFWVETICGICLGNGSWRRCRQHLLADASRGLIQNLSGHYNFLNRIFNRLVHFSRSFRWECQGTDTDEDRAALISAVGWCSGWNPFLKILGIKK